MNVAYPPNEFSFSAALIAIGIFFYMPANIMPLAGEGATQAVSRVARQIAGDIAEFFVAQ